MLNYVIEGSIEAPGVLVATSMLDWQYDDEIDVTRGDYLISVPSGRLRQDEQTRWRFPDVGERYRARMFGLVSPDMPIRCSRPRGPVRILSCRIDKAHFERTTGIADCNPRQLRSILHVEDPAFRTLFGQMADEVSRPGFAAGEYIASLSSLLLIDIARRLRAAAEEPKGEGALAGWQLRRIEEAVRDGDPADRLTIDALAGLCRVSSRHLMRGFKAATGTTLHKYIEQVRLERTRAMLEADELPLKAIAGAMGFASPSHLSVAFRKGTGLTPSEYRARLREGRFQ
jgi:AraC-like DNA-binding protein